MLTIVLPELEPWLDMLSLVLNAGKAELGDIAARVGGATVYNIAVLELLEMYTIVGQVTLRGMYMPRGCCSSARYQHWPCGAVSGHAWRLDRDAEEKSG